MVEVSAAPRKLGLMIVGIGNTLRRDDGAGVAVVERLRAALETSEVVMVTTHQLLPELAEDIAKVSDVVFVDARTDVSPGRVTVEEISVGDKQNATGHYVTPSQLLAMSRMMYGAGGALRGYVIGIGVANMDHGEGLTTVVHHAVSRVAERIYRAILHWMCDGRFSIRETDQVTVVEVGAACELKWVRNIERELRDA